MANIGVNSMPKTYKSYANGYKALIDASYKKGKDYRDGIFTIDDTDNWNDRIVEIGGLETPGVWNDGDRAKQASIEEGFAKVFTQVRYGEEVPIGYLMRKFQGRDVNITRRAVSKLGTEFYRVEQKSPFSLLSYGFSDVNAYLTALNGYSVSNLASDGKRLFSTQHLASPYNSTTWSNVLSDNKEVSEAALTAMIANLDAQLDSEGRQQHYGREGYIWLVPFAQVDEAWRIVNSDLRAGTADNDMNVFKTKYGMIEVRGVPWLGEVSSTAHFLMAREVVDERQSLQMLYSERFMTDDYEDEATKTVYVRGSVMFDVGIVSPAGMVGSLGTGSGTYTA